LSWTVCSLVYLFLGNVSLDVIALTCLTGPFASYIHPDYSTTSLFNGSTQLFLLQTEYSISEDLYRLTNKFGTRFPITSSVQLHSLGESTITKEASIFSANDETLLALAKVKHALVDMTTRKSVTLPKEFRDKYAASCKPASSFSRFVVPDPTAGAYHCNFLMRYSDTDALLHVNNLVYVNLCLDCATMASMRGGYLRSFTGDICSRLVKTLRCSYILEIRAQEVVRAIVWEDTIIPDTLHFLFTKEGKNIFYGFMEFFPEVGMASKL